MLYHILIRIHISVLSVDPYQTILNYVVICFMWLWSDKVNLHKASYNWIKRLCFVSSHSNIHDFPKYTHLCIYYNYYEMYTCIGLNYINNVLLGSVLFTLADIKFKMNL